jgi:hypothetical protein
MIYVHKAMQRIRDARVVVGADGEIRSRLSLERDPPKRGHGLAPNNNRRVTPAQPAKFAGKMLHEVMPEKSWAGRRCFLIGGGPSLKGFDWARLHGELVIGINRAFEVIDPAILYSMDIGCFYAWANTGQLPPSASMTSTQLTERYKSLKATRVMQLGKDQDRLDAGIYGIDTDSNVGGNPSLARGILPNTNSGYGALALAIAMGASEIYLLGYDMGAGTDSPKQSWWHDGYATVQGSIVYKRMLVDFDHSAEEFKQRARIVNLNPASNLRHFEFGNIEDIQPTPAKPLVVGYYTIGTPYEAEAREMERSAHRMGLDVVLRGIEVRGSWVENCAAKPEIIRDVQAEFPDRAILYVDADARFQRYPALFDGCNLGDMACHRLGATDELLSGTLYFGPTPAARALVEAWIEECKANPLSRESRALSNAMTRFGGDVRSFPPEYCRVRLNGKQHSGDSVIEIGNGKEKTVYVNGYLGFGDNISQRPFIKRLSKTHDRVYLETPLPELYFDIPNVAFVRPKTNLRTQMKNVSASTCKFVERPTGVHEYDWRVMAASEPEPHNPHEFYARLVGGSYDFKLPVRPQWIEAAYDALKPFPLRDKPKICLIKWPTVRKEWRVESRCPSVDAFQRAIDRVRKDHWIVSWNDLKDGEEWLVGEPKNVDIAFDHGELSFTTICGLSAISDLVICYPSVAMLLGIATRTKTLCLFGGHLGPKNLLSPKMGLEQFSYIEPDNPKYMPGSNYHIDTTVSPKRLDAAVDDLLSRAPLPRKCASVAIPPGIGDMHWIALKLDSFKKKNEIDHLTVVAHQDAGHQNSLSYLQSLSFVDAVEDRGYLSCWKFGAPRHELRTIRKSLCGCDYVIEFNSDLEDGKRLEDILPEYEVDWNMPISISEEDVSWAESITDGIPPVLFYGSSNSMNRAWAKQTWNSGDWAILARLVFEDTGHKPFMIGQTWDADFSKEIQKHPDGDYIRFIVGKTSLGQVFALLKSCAATVAFASGLPIMSTHFRRPTVMLWPERGVTPDAHFDKPFQTSWVPPDMLESGKYVPMSFGATKTTPQGILEKMRGII